MASMRDFSIASRDSKLAAEAMGSKAAKPKTANTASVRSRERGGESIAPLIAFFAPPPFSVSLKL